MVTVERTGKFEIMLEKLYEDYPDLEPIVKRCIHWFQKNPRDSRLRNHPLAKRLAGKWAFSITNDIRIIYEKVGKQSVRFLAVGPHRSVYP